MLLIVMHNELRQSDIGYASDGGPHPVLHWLRRAVKLIAAVALIPPVLLAVLIYFSAWKMIAKWRG